MELKQILFPGGEVHVQIAPDVEATANNVVIIQSRMESANDIMSLLMTVDATRRLCGSDVRIKLRCPYVPYARQDRAANPGEALSIRVMCDLINSLKLAEIEVWDVHSDVTLALLNNVKHYEQHMFIQRIPVDSPDLVYVAPDAGAVKKVVKAARGYGRDMITAEKMRSTKTGEITGTRVHSSHVGDRPVIMLDDICDGGRTFIELAKVLRAEVTDGPIYLYVTHGIFSQGLDVFRGLIDGIYVANPWSTVNLDDPIITKINMDYDPTHN